MTTRRTVANPLALAVLAELLVSSLHPYEIARRLEEHDKGRDFKFTRGSVYMVVEQLERAGFVAEQESIRDSQRPERTVYALTPAGRDEFFDWMRDLVSQPHPEYPQFGVALSLLSVLPPTDAAELLGERRAALTEAVDEIRTAVGSATAAGVAWVFLVEEEYRVAILEAERGFVDKLILSLSQADHIRAWHEFFGSKS
jgi:DNA-binding PadR family transcriptional regulator